MTAQKIVDSFMDDRYRHDEAEAAVLRLLELVDRTAGAEPEDVEETPTSRRHEAAAMLLAYFLRKTPSTF